MYPFFVRLRNHFFFEVLSDKVHMWMLGIVITTSSHTLGTFGNWRFTIDDVAKDADVTDD